MQLITSLAVLAAAASTVSALGNAIIYNKCPYDVYVWPTDANRAPTTPTTIKAGGMFSEGYHTPSAGGVSIKISKSTSCAAGIITQFEYTVSAYSGKNFLWYDGSNVDCTADKCPFQADGVFLTTSRGNSGVCKECVCPPSTSTTAKCDCFYAFDVDDRNSFSCDDAADTMLYLCASSASGSSSPAAVASSVASPIAKAATTASVSVSTAAPAVTSSSSVAQINEAPVTLVTKTRTKHAHGRRHHH
ncbi:hypothetical protein EJ08DRAFT_446630 [Tothia fuscella]|uniref:Uncharacterized protein n=1 Tax=Tothia fuscella TaxID=1048955 RepID=A0A9P4TUT7_9PEZI|nr:hypothetical protein EJ08DRAFT_446630 [Tothia fuscella]